MVAFETDGIVLSGGGSNASPPPSPTSLFRGYRSSLGGTLVGGGGGGGNHAKRSSSILSRQNAPVLQGIRVTRVVSDDDFDSGDASGRPSSAPGPTRAGGVGGTTGPRSQRGFFPSTPDPGPDPGDNNSTAAAAVGNLSRSAPSSPKRPGLSSTVKNLLGTKDGLAQLRLSLQDEDTDPESGGGKAGAAAKAAVAAAMGSSGRSVSMIKGEAVAVAAGQRGTGAAAAKLSEVIAAKRRPSSAPSPATVSKKASVFGGLVQTLVESNVREAIKRETGCREKYSCSSPPTPLTLPPAPEDLVERLLMMQIHLRPLACSAGLDRSRAPSRSWQGDAWINYCSSRSG